MKVIDLAAFVATAESCDGLPAAMRFGASTHGRRARFYLVYGTGGYIERHRKREGGGFTIRFRGRAAEAASIEEAEATLYAWNEAAGALPVAEP